ncbi:hypothetical protein NLG97_g2448 [Lecanicillium saksenae]|uniref:Uncharacterized protein n=1 Tax=Lecanicillium saksenae TaxID=468837 RepID=A0ACC1R0Z4_9HYPO|nr:hypothetical protein NLG97_g2448 [Lecanicillium saksenae]
MSLNIPQAPNSGLFKQGYNKYARLSSLPPSFPPATPVPRHHQTFMSPRRKTTANFATPLRTATTPKMAPSSANIDRWRGEGFDASRFRDKEAVESIWKTIELNMRSKGWKKDAAPTAI